mgnify:CR=1 FL=1
MKLRSRIYVIGRKIWRKMYATVIEKVRPADLPYEGTIAQVTPLIIEHPSILKKVIQPERGEVRARKSKLTIELWSRGRVDYCNVLLASFLSQSYTEWDLTFLEDFDQNYEDDPIFPRLLKLIKERGHKVIFLKPRSYLGCVKSAIEVMKETETEYAMKMDDDHYFEPNAFEELVNVLEKNKSFGAIGGMLYPIGVESFERKEHIPRDFNKWSGPNKRIWNDYSTRTSIYPSQVVEVDFVRAPFMYRASELHKANFLEDYGNAGYSPMAFRIESEICNTLKKKYGYKTVIHTGVVMWHFASSSGGCRMIDQNASIHDDNVYYKRWEEFHK